MELISLDCTGLKVSRAALGTMTFGAQAGEQASNDILDCALAAGINFIDTANIYARGASEEILGRALKGRRNQVVLASKVRGAMGDGPLDSGLSCAAMVKALEETLRRLQTDYLDIYYLHQPDYQVPIEDTLETMHRLVRDGKVRFPATSNYSSWQVHEALSLAEARGYLPPRIAQPMYSLLARGVEQEFFPMAQRFGVAVIAYNPLAGGMLTGKHADRRPAAGSRFVNNQVYRERYWHPQYLDAVDTLSAAACRAGRSLISIALNWLLRHTPTACVVLGASRVEQLEENLATLADGPLPPEVLRACDEVWAGLRGITPQYNR